MIFGTLEKPNFCKKNTYNPLETTPKGTLIL